MGGEGGLITGPKSVSKQATWQCWSKYFLNLLISIQAKGGGRLISEGFTVVDPGEGSGPTPLKNVQSGTQAPWSWPASGPLQNLRNYVSQNMVAIGTSSRHAGRTTRKCCAIKKWSHIPCLRRHFFPARFPICFLFGFLEFQTDRFDLKKPGH